ncbi:MAG: DUF393 domain-containing protein [Anaerolineaceae bacterium]|nr:MAG: DUF393 domain-containing protein [Anaerolineaceae bacterium]
MLNAIYDGQCVICNTTKRLVKALDWFNRVTFVDLHQHAVVAQRFPFIDQQAAMGEIHVVDDANRVFAGFAGTRRLLRALPLGWPLYLLLRLPIIGGWIGPAVYRFIARNRYAINRLLGVDLSQQADTETACKADICQRPMRDEFK